MNEIRAALESLAKHRPIFHSEADFQHALAWELQTRCPDARIRLEVPLYGIGGRAALDIVATLGSARIAIELKYFKARLEHQHEEDRYALAATVARDISRHDVIKDISRLEHAVGSGQATQGYAVVLCNDPGFWRNTGFEGIDEAFKIHHGRTVRGTLVWHESAGSGTTKRRDKPLTLFGAYEMDWCPYSDLGVRNGEFRALVIPVIRGTVRTHNPNASGESLAGLSAEESADGQTPPRPQSAPVRRGLRDRTALRAFFAAQTASEIHMTFDEIEAIRGRLPASATNHSAWWHHVASHAQAVWELEGYKASPRCTERMVVFRRI